MYDKREELFVSSKLSNETTKNELQKLKNVLFSDKPDNELFLNGNVTIANFTLSSELELAQLRSRKIELELENLELQVDK